MRRLLATAQLDVRLQARSKLYAIGILVAVLLGVAARMLVPNDYMGRGLTAFYVTGVGSTTFMFGSSMLLLEKGEGTLAALRTTMLTTRDYVGAKVLTLTAFCLVESAIVLAIAWPDPWPHPVWLTLGIAVLGAFYVLVGLALSSAHQAVTSFLLPSGAIAGMVLQLPFLTLLNVPPTPLWYAVPTQAPLLLILAAFEPIAPWQWAYVAAMSPAMLLGGAWICRRRFATHIQLAEAS